MKQETLTKLIELADAHQAADEYKPGDYAWKGGACAIGCTIRDATELGYLPDDTRPDDHKALAKMNGVPEMVWRLVDHIFEGLPKADKPAWTPRFLRAIRPDADYANLPARIMARFADRLAENALNPGIKAASEHAAKLWRRRAAGDDPSRAEWIALEEQADAARQQADAARQQADAARQQADAAWQQAYAAWRQADAAWRQADAAWRQADAAWRQADAARQQADAAWQQAYAAWRQADAARDKFWLWCADVVCEELQRV